MPLSSPTSLVAAFLALQATLDTPLGLFPNMLPVSASLHPLSSSHHSFLQSFVTTICGIAAAVVAALTSWYDPLHTAAALVLSWMPWLFPPELAETAHDGHDR